MSAAAGNEKFEYERKSIFEACYIGAGVRAREIGFVRFNICIRFARRVMHFNLTFVSFHL